MQLKFIVFQLSSVVNRQFKKSRIFLRHHLLISLKKDCGFAQSL